MMREKLRQLILPGWLAILSLIPTLTWAQFDPDRGIEGTNLVDRPATDLLEGIMRYGLSLITVLGVLGFVVAGLMFIVGGALGKGEMAKKMLMYSIVGIIVSLSGYIVIRLISNLISGQIDTGI